MLHYVLQDSNSQCSNSITMQEHRTLPKAFGRPTHSCHNLHLHVHVHHSSKCIQPFLSHQQSIYGGLVWRGLPQEQIPLPQEESSEKNSLHRNLTSAPLYPPAIWERVLGHVQGLTMYMYVHANVKKGNTAQYNTNPKAIHFLCGTWNIQHCILSRCSTNWASSFLSRMVVCSTY